MVNIEEISEPVLLSDTKPLQQILRENHFWPLCLASAIAIAFYLGERSLSQWRGPRLHLNLFLAWVPYFLGILLLFADGKWAGRIGQVLRIAILLGWFFFFPNAPYLITDFAYLDWTHYDLWQRVILFCIFAQCGLMLAMAQLLMVESYLSRHCGKYPAGLFVFVSILFAGFGVYVGRFLRWNSWDLLYHPFAVLADSLKGLNEPTQGIRPVVFSIALSLILGCLYCFVRSVKNTSQNQSDS